jgi:hypothetical protein
MRTRGGGWTLVLSTSQSATYPALPAFSQSYEDWLAVGVGTPSTTPRVPSSQYVMPLEQLRRLVSLQRSYLRFSTDALTQLARLRKVEMTTEYAWRGQNSAAVAAALCGSESTTSCFLRDRGMPFTAPGSPATGAEQCLIPNANVGFWYDPVGCYSHDPFRVDDAAVFCGTTAAPATQKWMWWVR